MSRTVKQSASTSEQQNFNALCTMKQLAMQMRDEISGESDLDRFADLLHEGWELKRSLGNGISNSMIDDTGKKLYFYENTMSSYLEIQI